jgi:hypothetical protein
LAKVLKVAFQCKCSNNKGSRRFYFLWSILTSSSAALLLVPASIWEKRGSKSVCSVTENCRQFNWEHSRDPIAQSPQYSLRIPRVKRGKDLLKVTAMLMKGVGLNTDL